MCWSHWRWCIRWSRWSPCSTDWLQLCIIHGGLVTVQGLLCPSPARSTKFQTQLNCQFDCQMSWCSNSCTVCTDQPHMHVAVSRAKIGRTCSAIITALQLLHHRNMMTRTNDFKWQGQKPAGINLLASTVHNPSPQATVIQILICNLYSDSIPVFVIACHHSCRIG